ncbi:hypothetical protein HNV11_11100 [Spirosoma taeanense]|uniref:Uncharacterized protein n=1 Tax=Spirosoma taeanense TaxID=2735870 RepID=A0A6M5Y9J5_9BACT|nr:hypothetical protein [Spirosoma taeanense]QJW89883.1 hypothetical protein HNV11_11100 [Spirosoma taeanense]
MKTDRFADIIRRKLDSIRPEFADEDWERMQATMQQAGLPQQLPTIPRQPFGGYATHLVAAGTIGTLFFLTTTLWQHYELKHLRETVQATHPSASGQQPGATEAPPAEVKPAMTPSDDRRPSGTTASATTPAERNEPAVASSDKRVVKRDTVYITRYVSVPAPASQSRPDVERRPAPRSERYATTDQPATPGASVESPAVQASQPTVNLPDRTARSPLTSDRGGQLGRNKGNRSDLVAAAPSGQRARNRQNAAGDYNPANPVSTPDRSGQSQPSRSASDADGAEPAVPTVSFERAASRPIRLDTVYWDELLARRAKRMRPARVTLAGGQSPIGRSIEPFLVHFRVGPGAEVAPKIINGGVYAELLGGKHLLVGAGLSVASYAGGTFLTDEDFYMRTHRDFRREYARGIDPRNQILNISTRTTRIQVPLYLGYRIPLSQTLSLLPTVGTNLNLQSNEQVTFYYRQPLRGGFDAASYRLPCRVDAFNNLTLATGLEWQHKHWAFQAGPVASMPTQNDRNWYKGASVGLRGRVFYQF